MREATAAGDRPPRTLWYRVPMVRSRKAGVVASALWASVLGGGCGGSAHDPESVPEIARPVAPPRGAVAAEGVGDGTQPRDLALVLRVRDPEDSVDAASFVTGTPLSLLLSLATHAEDLRMVGAIDMRAPLDAAVLLPQGVGTSSGDEPGPEPPAAVTFGVGSTERFTSAFPAGAVARPRRDGVMQIAHDGVVCAVPTTRGPARVICGSSSEAIARLQPWMMGTLAREPLPAVDAQLTLLAEPARDAIRQLVARELRDEAASARQELQQIGVADPELLAVPGVLLDEVEALAEDADRLDVALDVDAAKRTATVRATARFRGASAWTTRVLADPAERRGPPPPIYWRLPRDADAASWALSANPRHFAGMRRVLAKAVSLGMSRTGATPDETAALVGVIDGFPSSEGSWASAQGRLAWKAPRRGGVTPQNAVADLKDRMRALLGWGVAVVDAPPAPWVSWASDVESGWKKAIVGLRRASPDDPMADAPELRIVRAPVGYPPATVALDAVTRIDSDLAWSLSPRLARGEDGVTPTHPEGPRAKGSVTLRMVVVPDGDRTLLGWSLDDAALRAHVRSALQGAPAAGTLAARPDLKRLERPGTGGGFFTMRTWLDLALDMTSTPDLADGDQRDVLLRAITAMPNQGTTPVLTFADGTAGTAPSLSVELLVQEGTVDDLRALGQHMIGQGIKELTGGVLRKVEPAITPTPRPVP